MLVFPSYLSHRVRRVTAGSRTSLVVWIVGERLWKPPPEASGAWGDEPASSSATATVLRPALHHGEQLLRLWLGPTRGAAAAGGATEVEDGASRQLASADRCPWLVLLGTVLHHQQRHAESAGAFGMAIAADESQGATCSAKAHIRRGMGMHVRGRLSEALREYRAAVRIRPDQASGWQQVGLAVHGLGRREEALAALDTATALSPTDVGLQRNRAAVLAAT